MKTVSKKLFLLFFFLTIFQSCSKNPQKIENMRLCFHSDPTSLDPRRNSDVCTSNLLFMVYEGLTRLLPEGKVELALAESVDISPDGKTYIFHLRNANWSDGVPVTAHDFEYSWKKTLTPSFGAACPYLLYSVLNAEEAVNGTVDPSQVAIYAVDDHTLKIELENPTPYFLSLITFCNFYPIPKHKELENPAWHHNSFVTNGPFIVKEWDRNQAILLEKNQKYWDAKNVHLDAIHILIVSDEKTSLRMFENGDLDVLNSLTSPLSIDEVVSLKQKGKVMTNPLGGTLFCTFNLQMAPLSNRSIRKALSMAIDRMGIIENISQLSEEPATRYIPSVVLATDKPLFPVSDIALAKELFQQGVEELGAFPAEPILLNCQANELHRRIAQAIQQQWKELFGLNIELCESDFKTQMSLLQNRNYAIALDSWVVQYTDPVSILERFKFRTTKKNYPGYENPEYIAILDKAAAVNDPDERLRLLQKAEALMAEEMPLAPIYHFNQAILDNSQFVNLEFSPLGTPLFKRIRPTGSS